MLLPEQTMVAYGDGMSAFMVKLINNLLQLYDNVQGEENRLSWWLDLLFGSGILCHSYTSPILTPGTGLVVDVGECQPLIPWPLPGFIDAVHHITVPANQSTVYLWLKADGVPTYTLTNVNPGSVVDVDTGLNTLPAIKLGTCSTDASSVTGCTDDFNVVCLDAAGGGGGTVTFSEAEDLFTAGDGGAWDADAVTRLGGTGSHYNLTLAHTPGTASIVKVYREGTRLIVGDDYTVSGATVSILSGSRPVQLPSPASRPEVIRIDSTPAAGGTPAPDITDGLLFALALRGEGING